VICGSDLGVVRVKISAGHRDDEFILQRPYILALDARAVAKNENSRAPMSALQVGIAEGEGLDAVMLGERPLAFWPRALVFLAPALLLRPDDVKVFVDEERQRVSKGAFEKAHASCSQSSHFRTWKTSA
jgi:hypothetical protein